MHRRELLKYALGSSAMAMAGMPGLSFAQSGYAFNDYRAVVMLFLGGGNDAFNMLVPATDDAATGYGPYRDARRHLAVGDVALDIANYRRDGVLDLDAAGNPYSETGTKLEECYRRGHFPLRDEPGLPLFGAPTGLGFNSLMPELADLYDQGKLAVVSNSGALVEPTSRAGIQNNTARLPNFLFAHNHQTRFLTAARNIATDRSGWAGRMADRFALPSASMPLGIDVARYDIGLFNGDTQRGLGIGSDFNFELNAARNIDHSRTQILDALPGAEPRSLFGQFIRDSQPQHYDALLALRRAYSNAPDVTLGTDPYGNPLFERPDLAQSEIAGVSKTLFAQLKAIATTLAIAKDAPELASQRQVYFAFMPGYDTHANQIASHGPGLRSVSLALWHFQHALEQLGLQDAVTTTIFSEFGRSLTINDDGTDHGWGGHQLVMGSQVNGGRRIGELADMRRGGESDYDVKGRMIPSTSQDQIHATLCSWLGLRDEDLPQVFPNLANFRSGSGIDTALLGNLMRA